MQSVYRVYHVHEICISWIEPDEVRHSLEQQLSRVEARNPAQQFCQAT